jgi:hypothetical protein
MCFLSSCKLKECISPVLLLIALGSDKCLPMTLMGIAWKSLRDGADSQRYRARSRAATPSGRIAHSLNGDRAIIYLETKKLQRTFHEPQTSQDPFAVWVRQRAKDLYDGVDLPQIDPGSLSQYVFEAVLATQHICSKKERSCWHYQFFS